MGGGEKSGPGPDASKAAVDPAKAIPSTESSGCGRFSVPSVDRETSKLLMPVALVGALYYVVDWTALTIMSALAGGVWWCLKEKPQDSTQPVRSDSSESFQDQGALQPQANSEQAAK